MKNKIAILYHSDLDGFGAAYAAWWHFTACEKVDEPEMLFLPVQYGEEPPLKALRAFAPNEIMILDFSYPADTLRALSEEFGEWVTVIDHHKTALEELKAWGGKYAFDLTRSGAVLTWDSLNREGVPAPEILLYVQDRDLWKFELEHSKEINAFIATLDWSFDAWSDFYLPEAYDAGKAILRFQAKQVEGRVKGGNESLSSVPDGRRDAGVQRPHRQRLREHLRTGRCALRCLPRRPFLGLLLRPSRRQAELLAPEP